MTDQDAMKLALEALETEVSIDWTNNHEFVASAEKMHEAIAALKERLTQPPRRTEQEMDELQSLRQFRDAAFLAHPNIDLDIEAAHGIKEDT